MSGAALLPFAFVALLTGIFSFQSMDISSGLFLFAICLAVLMLFSGLTRIGKLAERPASLAVPLMVIVSAWISRALYREMLMHF